MPLDAMERLTIRVNAEHGDLIIAKQWKALGVEALAGPTGREEERR